MDGIFSRLKQITMRDGLPKPSGLSSDSAGQIVLVGNRSWRTDGGRTAAAATATAQQLAAAQAEAEQRIAAAQAEAELITADARRRSDDILAAADRIRADSQEQAGRKLQTAEIDAGKLVARARRKAEMEASDVLIAAQAKADKIRDLADADAAAVHSRARKEIDRLTTKLDDLRKRVIVTPTVEQSQVAALVERAQDLVEDPTLRQDVVLLLGDVMRESNSLLAATADYFTSRRDQAEALFEATRDKAAVAATDFETKLAKRRELTERDLAARQAKAEKRLAEIESEAEKMRLEAEKMRTDAERRARSTIETAQRQADDIIADARGKTDRIRSEAERELAALTHRRDSINAQLYNVREMLRMITAGKTSVEALAVINSLELTPDASGPPESAQPANTPRGTRARKS